MTTTKSKIPPEHLRTYVRNVALKVSHRPFHEIQQIVNERCGQLVDAELIREALEAAR